MFGIMLQKMWHKKWMNLSLLLGIILLVATAVSFPLYQEAAYDRMVQDEFDHYVSSKGTWPAQFSMTIVSKKERNGATIAAMEKLVDEIYDNLHVDEKETVMLYILHKSNIHSELNRPDASDISVRLGAKTDLEAHINIIGGENYSESGMTEDGAIEVLISQSCMVSQGLLVGETIVFNDLKDYDGNKIRMHINGVFEPSSDNDPYWQEKLGELDNVCLMKMDLFRQNFTGEKAIKFNENCMYWAMFNYDKIRAKDVDYLISTTRSYTEEGAYRKVISRPAYMDVLDSYLSKQKRIDATLAILQIPVLIMLAAFLLMISSQMYEMERNEISVIKSRGSSRAQIFRLYLYQGLLLTSVGSLIGVFLGMLMSRLLGSTRNFLVFDFSETLEIHFTKNGLIYMLAAALLGLMCLTIPAIRHSRVSIVNLKQQKAMRKKSLWQKLYLDIVCIVIAGYGYYSFNHNKADLAEQVLRGESLDPLLYISSSLMIIGLGLLFLRIQPVFLSLVYKAGNRFWKPASFISFMENVKNGRKQHLIMLFLIMTISLGMYHSAVARTIVENAVRNTEYLDGADLILKEVWTEITDREGAATGSYVEPDLSKYVTADFMEQYTRVIFDSSAYVSGTKNDRISATMMGIHTKEYGGVTWVNTELNNEHYYNYLNELSQVEDGVLLSVDFRDKAGYKVGDTISFTNSKGKKASCKVVDFFSYWPGYSPVTSQVSEDGQLNRVDQYLIVANYQFLNTKMGAMPYEIWAQLKPGITDRDVYAWIKENDVRLTKYQNRNVDLEETANDPLLQGTNGVLTMGFVVTIILCGVGYLIYWIMSIKERELVFGVLRASGFHPGELFHMLINEQVFCGLFSVLAGLGIGRITSALFVPILQQAYASTSQVLPMLLFTNTADLVRLVLVISAVMLVCLAVLTGMILRMNVAKALKLGED